MSHNAELGTVFDEVLECLSDGVSMLDAEGRHIFVNRALCEMTGFTRSELLGTQPPFLYWPAEEMEVIGEALAKTIAGQGSSFELMFKRRDETRFAVVVSSATVKDPAGGTSKYIATVKDISAHKTMERALRDSEQRWRSIAENPFDFVVVIDRNYRYSYINHVVQGLRPEDLLGKLTPFDFVAPQYCAAMKEALETSFREARATSYEVYVAQIDGWYSSIVGPIKDEGVVVALSILTRDITAEKRAAQAERESERRLQLAVSASGVGMFDINLEQQTVYATPRAYELLGLPPDATVQSFGEFYARLEPEDREGAVAAGKRALEDGGLLYHECRVVTPSGESVWLAIRGGTSDDAGGPRRFAGFVTDISERKLAQARQQVLETQLRESQKLETIGTLASGIAHDLNNILSPIFLLCELVSTSLPVDHEAQADLQGIAAASARARDLVRRIVRFSRPNDSEKQVIDLKAIIVDDLKLIAASLPATIEISTTFPADPVWIRADPTQVQQVLANLCANSYQAMRANAGGTLRIELACIAASAKDQAAKLTVRDNGSGMDEATRRRAFEPFFTTRAAGEGSGLGLSIVHRIVSEHQAQVVVKSEPGQGTSFDIFFPLCPPPPGTATGLAAAPSAAPTLASTPLPRRERILCVDDETAIGDLTVRILQRAGYSVRYVSAPLEAKRLLEQDPFAFDLLLTDQTMPKRTGLDLAADARSLNPEIRVIVMSGLGDSDFETTALAMEIRHLLTKPFSPDDLVRALDKAFGRG